MSCELQACKCAEYTTRATDHQKKVVFYSNFYYLKIIILFLYFREKKKTGNILFKTQKSFFCQRVHEPLQ
jgi:hypothetical protein